MILYKKTALNLNKKINIKLIIATFKDLEITSWKDFNDLCDSVVDVVPINSDFLQNDIHIVAIFESLTPVDINEFFDLCMKNNYFNEVYSKKTYPEDRVEFIKKLELSFDQKKEIVREFADLIIAYSEGPDKKWQCSVKLKSENKLEKIPQPPKVDFAKDVGLGTRNEHITPLEKRISENYQKMLSKLTQFKREYSNAEFLQPLEDALKKLRPDICNQLNASSLVDAYNIVLSKIK